MLSFRESYKKQVPVNTNIHTLWEIECVSVIQPGEQIIYYDCSCHFNVLFSLTGYDVFVLTEQFLLRALLHNGGVWNGISCINQYIYTVHKSVNKRICMESVWCKKHILMTRVTKFTFLQFKKVNVSYLEELYSLIQVSVCFFQFSLCQYEDVLRHILLQRRI